MNIVFHKKFKKQYAKLSPKTQKQFAARLDLFIENRENPVLRLHKLTGSLTMYWSINVDGDTRALFVEHNGAVVFEKIGTHSELY